VKVLGVSGSPRRGGNSDLILEAAVRSTGARFSVLHLSEMDFSSCVGCEGCRKDLVCTRFDDDLTPVYGTILEAKGLILVSPVYNYNITSWMKAFIDRLYCFYDFNDDRPRGWSSRLAGQGRAAALAVVAEQVKEEDLGVSMAALRAPIQALGYTIAAQLHVFGKFEAGIVRKDREAMNHAAALGGKLSAVLER